MLRLRAKLKRQRYIIMRNFINARLNKDNFWNLMFFLGMALGYNFASFLKIQPASSIIALVTTFVTVFMVKRNASITFDKEKMEFVHANGSRSKNSGVGLIFLILGSLFFTSVLIGLIGIDLLISKILASAAFFILPVLYCILRNLPIAVYFKKEAWVGNGNVTHNSVNSSNNFSSNAFDDSRRTGMNYDYLPNNMWHSSYLDRHRR